MGAKATDAADDSAAGATAAATTKAATGATESAGTGAAPSAQAALAALNDVVEQLLTAHDGPQVCRIVGRAVHRLVPDAIVLAEHVTPDGRSLKVGDVAGMGDRLPAAADLIGKDPRMIEWPLAGLSPQQRAAVESATLTPIAGGVHALGLGRLSKRVAGALGRLLGVDTVYGMGCSWEGRIMGVLVLLAPAGCDVQTHAATIESIVRQAAFAIQRTNAEAARNASEADLRATIDGLDDAVHVVDADLRVRLTNAAFDEWRRRLGCPDDAVGRPLLEVCPFVDEAVLEHYRAVLADGERRETVQELTAGDDRLVAETRLVPVRENGAVTGVITMVRDITARALADEALRRAGELLLENEARLERAQRLAHIGDWTWVLATDESYWSDEVYRIFGMEPGERRPGCELARELAHPDDRERLAAAVAAALESGDEFRLEYRAVRADGATIWVCSEATVQRDAAGVALGVVGTIQDVTKRRSQEERVERDYLREHALDAFVSTLMELSDTESVCRRVSRAVHELVPDAYIITSAPEDDGVTFRLIDVEGLDKHIERLLGLLPGDPFKLRFPISDITPEELELYESGRLECFPEGIYSIAMRRIPRPVCRAVERLLNIGEVRSMGFSWHGRHYGGITILAPKGVSLDEHAETIETMVHQASIAMERGMTLRALARSEERYRGIFQNAVLGIWRTDPSGRYLDANPAAAHIYGYDSPEQMLREVSDVARDCYVDPSHRDEFLRLIEEHGEVRDYVLQNKRRDGSLVWIRENAVAVRDADGRTICYEGTMEDVTAEVVAGEQARIAQEQAWASAERLREALDATVQAMGALTEIRDPYTAGHDRRVTELAVALARRMGMSADSIAALRMAGEVHDIGKIAVPAEILNKPGPLTDMEYVLVKQHPQLAYAILDTVSFEWPIARIVLQHHERMDGSGYPNGIRGDEILPEARVLAVADVVESMASHRPYRPALGIDAALAEIEQGRGTWYDPAVVDACLDVIRKDGFKFSD